MFIKMLHKCIIINDKKINAKIMNDKKIMLKKCFKNVVHSWNV